MSTTLLIREHPLQVLPALAAAIGLNEAIFLQQVHYWINRTENVREGYKWVYNSYTDWHAQFPFWSIDTIKRTVHSLETQSLIFTANFNAHRMDKTKWYRINYERLAEIEGGLPQPWGQNAPTGSAKCPDVEGNLHRAIPETSQETTQETSPNEVSTASGFKEAGDGRIIVQHAFQDRAKRIIEKLGTPRSKVTSVLKVCRDEPIGLVEAAMSYAIDFPDARDRTAVFFAKIQRLKLSEKMGASSNR